MKALVDTHVLLWWLVDDPRLSPRCRTELGRRQNTLLWSPASTWEIAIKTALGKLRLSSPLRTYLPLKLAEQGLEILAIQQSHALEVAELPPHHRDPFDRILVAQARVERVAIVTGDARIRQYGVKVVW